LTSVLEQQRDQRFGRRALARAGSPVNQTQNPPALAAVRVSATSGLVNHSGSARRGPDTAPRTSVPEMVSVRTPAFTWLADSCRCSSGRYELLERQNRDADLIRVFQAQFLRRVRARDGRPSIATLGLA
jgi:hypothetical protein